MPGDHRPVPQPEPANFNTLPEGFHQQFAGSLRRFLDPVRHFRALANRPKQAMNLNGYDEVEDSAWFNNRNARRPLSTAEIARGPNQLAGPDTTSTWDITSAKREGATPGFTIRDRQGEQYIIKLDVPGYPELNSGAEIVCTRLFHAAGYHVPENYLVYFDPDSLAVAPNGTFTDEDGVERPLTDQDFQELVAQIETGPNGRFRAVASRFLTGKILGPFRYEGLRNDDDNDLIPHEHRRELRGLRVVAAWLNHYDTKANNSLDVYVDERYVKHYLIDFGSTLGSQGDEPMPVWVGHENAFDPPQIASNFLTLGLRKRPYEGVPAIYSPAIGHIESGLFDPVGFDSIFPNPAFENMTHRDAFWGAKIVMSFTDEQIDAAVGAARYSNPADAAYLAKTIKERRDLTGRYWFDRINPLERFTLDDDFLNFVDLEVEYGFVQPESTAYRFRTHALGGSDPGYWQISAEAHISLSGLSQGTDYCLEIENRREDEWGKQVRLLLNDVPIAAGGRRLAGIDREE